MSSDICKGSRDVVSDIMGFFANNTHLDFPPRFLFFIDTSPSSSHRSVFNSFLKTRPPGGVALWVMIALLGLLLIVVAAMWLNNRCRLRKPIRRFAHKEAVVELHSSSSQEGLVAVDEVSPLLSPQQRNRVLPRDVSFENLGLRLYSSGAIVLEGVTGVLRNSQVTAVMGPSGSGKTTFLSALAGRVSYGALVGKTFLNGREVALPRFQRSIGFVPQEDVMYRDLTVRETLMFAALAKGDHDLSLGDASYHVDQGMVCGEGGLCSFFFFGFFLFFFFSLSLSLSLINSDAHSWSYGTSTPSNRR